MGVKECLRILQADTMYEGQTENVIFNFEEKQSRQLRIGISGVLDIV